MFDTQGRGYDTLLERLKLTREMWGLLDGVLVGAAATSLHLRHGSVSPLQFVTKKGWADLEAFRKKCEAIYFPSNRTLHSDGAGRFLDCCVISPAIEVICADKETWLRGLVEKSQSITFLPNEQVRVASLEYLIAWLAAVENDEPSRNRIAALNLQLGDKINHAAMHDILDLDLIEARQ